MTGDVKYWLTRPRMRPAILAIAVTFCGVMPAATGCSPQLSS